jgi:hypothetical protein
MSVPIFTSCKTGPSICFGVIPCPCSVELCTSVRAIEIWVGGLTVSICSCYFYHLMVLWGRLSLFWCFRGTWCLFQGGCPPATPQTGTLYNCCYYAFTVITGWGPKRGLSYSKLTIPLVSKQNLFPVPLSVARTGKNSCNISVCMWSTYFCPLPAPNELAESEQTVPSTF